MKLKATLLALALCGFACATTQPAAEPVNPCAGQEVANPCAEAAASATEATEATPANPCAE